MICTQMLLNINKGRLYGINKKSHYIHDKNL